MGHIEITNVAVKLSILHFLNDMLNDRAIQIGAGTKLNRITLVFMCPYSSVVEHCCSKPGVVSASPTGVFIFLLGCGWFFLLGGGGV